MRRTKEDAEKTRLAILAAAERLFLQHGVSHTSLEQIARAGGVTRGAVYWHFENKAHLFNEMLGQIRLPPERLAQRLSGSAGANPLRELRDLCIEAMANLAGNPQKRNIMTILLRRCEFTEELRYAEELSTAYIDQFIDLCQALFERERERLRPGLGPRLAARTLHATLVGMLSDVLRDPDLFDPLTDAPVMIDTLFCGLIRDWSPAERPALIDSATASDQCGQPSAQP